MASHFVVKALEAYYRRYSWLSLWHWIGQQKLLEAGRHWTQNLSKLKKA